MTDIVERLRQAYADSSNLTFKLAADEIERLRGELAPLQEALKVHASYAAQVERMREALQALNLAYMGVPFQATAEQLQAMQVASDMARAAVARKP